MGKRSPLLARSEEAEEALSDTVYDFFLITIVSTRQSCGSIFSMDYI